jgi:chlorite dismutase
MSEVVKSPQVAGRAGQTTGIVRQFVNFIFYKTRDEWYRLPKEARERGREEFLSAIGKKPTDLMLYSYSTLGIRPDADFMFWRISERIEAIQESSAQLLKTGLGSYLETTYSYLSMTKRSMYIDHHEHPGAESSRTRVVAAQKPYIFVYPFVKTREWYMLPMERRQEAMNQHIAMGHKYPSIKINTTYSFGLDDQEFVVAFEGDRPQDFLDLVQEMRGTEASRYTVRDVPNFTCVRRGIEEITKELSAL